MGQDLKSENLTISIPYKGCDKNCPYCISKMTGYIKSDPELFFKNMNKALTVAKQAEITSVLITGKGEPTLDIPTLLKVIQTVNIYNLPLELQTNGIRINNADQLVVEFCRYGLNVIAISIDNKDQLVNYKSLIEKIKEYNLVVRLTVNVTNMLGFNFDQLLYFCETNNVDQLTIRRIIPPENPKEIMAAKWVQNNAPKELYDEIINEAKIFVKRNGKLIRQLSHGVNIYDLNGVAFTYSDYCIQEYNEGNNIRSLIYQEDGHLYTSWNSKASILF